MEIKVNAVLFKSPDNIDIFQIVVNDLNKIIVRKKLEYEKNKIINYLKYLKDLGEIKSLSKPKNKALKYQLDNIIKSKKTIDKSLEKIKTILF